MLKRLTKSGEYTHIFIILLIVTFFYFSKDVEYNISDYPKAAPIGIWLQQKLIGIISFNKLLNILLMLMISFFTNRITVSSEIAPRQSFIAATLITAFMLFAPASTMYTTSLIVMLLLVFALYNLMGMFGKQYPYLMVINASMAVSVASMILPHAFLFIFFIWFTFFTYSVNSWREWIISIIGIILPYIYQLFAFFWNDNLGYLFRIYTEFISDIRLNFIVPTLFQFISLIIMLIIFTISAFHFTNEASDKIISIRKKMWITFQFSFICLIMIAIGGEYNFLLLPVLYIPMAIMTSYALHNSRKSIIYDILFAGLLLSILFNRIGF